MPHLIYCGRLWRLSSDELSVPSACAAVIIVVVAFAKLVFSHILADGSHILDCSALCYSWTNIQSAFGVFKGLDNIFLSHSFHRRLGALSNL
jgi:hypothetical protein